MWRGIGKERWRGIKTGWKEKEKEKLRRVQKEKWREIQKETVVRVKGSEPELGSQTQRCVTKRNGKIS